MRYTPEQTKRWLSWLARQMKQENQTVFYPEQMQPDWLPSRRSRLFFPRLLGLVVWLIGALNAGLFFGLLTGPAGGVVVGLFIELAGGLLVGPGRVL